MSLIASALAFLAAPFMFKPAEMKPPPDPKSIDGLIAWLETKPKNQTYIWNNSKNCLLAQYGRAMGWGSRIPRRDYDRAVNNLGGSAWFILPAWAATEPFDGKVIEPSFGDIDTFGAALKRARAYKVQHRL